MRNQLAQELSPYLLQHADNPVHWLPWGDEAFLQAQREDKPIFLSIGYATCHWCHVMAHESFEDPEVAALMNDAFVCIKVDREERPDVDGVYMTVCQMMTGHGGWPLTVVMTPDKKPFFAGTYLPKKSRSGRIGMLDFIPQVKNLWNNDRSRIQETARYVADKLHIKHNEKHNNVGLDVADLQHTADLFIQRYDPEYGGFGDRPKFPSPHNLLFLLRSWKYTEDERLLQMVLHTLKQMRLGGLFDHVGYGFHRYATDARWFLPHFEKMLYDQAMLAWAYLEAYMATKDDFFANTAKEVLQYVLRDMQSEEGGFYSAEDADSEGEEGRFYVWEFNELHELATSEAEKNLIQRFGAARSGNFLDEATGRPMHTNVLHLTEILSAEENQTWQIFREKLFHYRKRRIHPLKDDKVLTDWNGLMVAVLAMAGRFLHEEQYIHAAEKALAFILEKMVLADGRLLHRFRKGEAGIQGNLDDYAFLILGLTELYQATFNPDYLEKALKLQEIQNQWFWDDQTGGYFFSPTDGEPLLFREKQYFDGAIPSGNAISGYNLLRLSRLTGEAHHEQQANDLLSTFSDDVKRYPTGFSFLMTAFHWLQKGGYEVILVSESHNEVVQEMISTLNVVYQPQLVVLLKTEANKLRLAEYAPFTGHYAIATGQVKAFVCQDHVCDQPINSVAALFERLR